MAKLNPETDTHNISSKPRNIKQHNQRLVISLLQEKGVLSTSELSVCTNLSKTTISKIFSELSEMKFVCSVGKGSSTNEGGKKPELYALNTEYYYTVIVSFVESGSITCHVLDMGREIKHSISSNIAESSNYEDIVRIMASLIKSSIASLSLSPEQICGIAVAYNGIVDTLNGSILYPYGSNCPSSYPLRNDLVKELGTGYSLYVDNAVRFAGYAELLFKENTQIDNLIIIRSNQNVTGCILVNQTFVTGPHNLIGEFGHLVIDPSSTASCYCGRKGCLESLISRDAIMSLAGRMSVDYPYSPIARKVASHDISAEDIFTAANSGEMFSKQVLDRIIEYFSILIHNIALLTNPKKIILQEIYASAGSYFLEQLKEKVRNFNLFDMHSDLEIVYSKFYDGSRNSEIKPFVLGACYYVSNRYIYSRIEES